MARIALLLLFSCDVVLSQSMNCALTQRPKSKPRYLKFCQDYNSEACCIPGHDLENQIQFEFLIDGLGPGCKNPMMYPDIRYFYCLGCDPDQPLYTNQTDAGEIVSVCQSFVDSLWRSNNYDECGVMWPNDCPAGFEDFDPYTCGDDLVIPKNEFPGPNGGINFMNKFKPPGMYDHIFVTVNDTVDENGNVIDSSPCWKPLPYRSSAGHTTASVAVAVLALAASMRQLL